MSIALKDSQQITGRILVVDDIPMVRKTLVEILRQGGHDVSDAESGEEALRLIPRQRFDLLISDLQMPGMGGMELVARVKARHPMITVVVITGYPTVDRAIEAMKRGATDFVSKPFTAEQIQHVVRKTLREQRLVVENRRLTAELNNKAVIERLNRQLHQKVNLLTKLYRISESFHPIVDNDAMLQHVVELAAGLTGSQRVSLMALDASRGHLVVRAAKGLPPDVASGARVRMGQGVAGRVARSCQPMRVTGKTRSDAPHASDPARAYQSESWLSVPLFIAREIFGVLNLTDKHDKSDF
jgi:CheY-like chemotaxis protein